MQDLLKILVCLLFCLVISLLMQLSRYNGEKSISGSLKSFIIELISPPGQVLNLLGGDSGNRTRDLLLAGQALSQLSYAPGLVLQEPRSGPED